MFTMDDWLGLVILMVGVASAIALIVMFVAGCVGVVRWVTLRRKARVLSDTMFSTCPICGSPMSLDAMHVCVPPLRHDVSTRPLTNDEIKALLPTVGDMSIGYRPSYGIEMSAGDDITTRKFSESEICEYFGVPVSLDSIIRDLHSAITDEHLEIRAHNRFSAILNRLENYRDS